MLATRLPLTLLVAAVAGTAAAQSTLVVPTQYATIQAAIAAAVPGDIVLVLPGTYFERIDFLGKAIAVRSANGAGTTTIDGGQLGTVVTFANGETPASVLEGFTVRNGLGIASPGGGVQCTGASPTLRACTITGNQGRAGSAGARGGAGGIEATASALRLLDCDVSGNFGGDGGSVASGAGGNGGAGGMLLATGSPPAVAPTVERCRFANNRGGVGGAGSTAGGWLYGRGGCGGVEMFTLASSTVFLGCAIVRNDGGVGGSGHGGTGGFDVYGATTVSATLTLASCIVVGNHGGNGGTASVLGFPGDGGGTLARAPLALRAFGTTIAGNATGLPAVATLMNVGGLNVSPPGGALLSSATLFDSIVWGNTAAGQPADVLVYVGSAAATACDLGAVTGPVSASMNLNVDPLFVNLAADDVHLTAASPCRHAGTAVPGLPLFDFEGDPRKIGPATDMGADEYEMLPGSREDLLLALSVNGAFAPAVNPSAAPAGSTVAISIASPGGSLASAYALLGLELWLPPNPPVGPVLLPEFHFSPAASPLVTFAGGIGASGVVLPVVIPAGLAGLAARVQAFALTPSAKNGVFAASAARDVVF